MGITVKQHRRRITKGHLPAVRPSLRSWIEAKTKKPFSSKIDTSREVIPLDLHIFREKHWGEIFSKEQKERATLVKKYLDETINGFRKKYYRKFSGEVSVPSPKELKKAAYNVMSLIAELADHLEKRAPQLHKWNESYAGLLDIEWHKIPAELQQEILRHSPIITTKKRRFQ